MPRGVMLALLVVGYITAGRIGLLLAFANENASPVWAPTGLAIGALLLVGLRAWPAVALGAFIVNLLNSGSIPAAVVFAVGNTLEAVAGAWLTRRMRATSAPSLHGRASDRCRAAGRRSP